MTAQPSLAATRASEAIIAAARQLLRHHTPPILIALDGPSGSGKSLLAGMVAEAIGAVVVPCDDFFAADVTDAEWEMRSASERVAAAIDWRRLRREALEPLLAGMCAQWRVFDFEAGVRADGSYRMRSDFTGLNPAPIVILDGAYSTQPELGNLIDLAVLVDAPAHIRNNRLAAREPEAFLAAWHARWDAAEAHYFAQVRPPSWFHLIVSTA